MENKIFVPVDAKERLPEKAGIYVVIHDNGLFNLSMFEPNLTFGGSISHWLEEVELPTYEDTRKELDSYSYSWSEPFRWGWKYGVKYILKLIKKEK